MLDKTGNRDIGLYLSLTYSHPLYSGIPSAILQMSRNVAVINDLLNIIGSGILMLYHNLATKIFEILSNPKLFLFGSLSINIVICVSYIRPKAIISYLLLSNI